ncbi:MAG: hypothetical protein ABIM74_02870 [candidate division WOR-3 bacterium]
MIVFLLAFSGNLGQRITLTGYYDIVMASASAAGADSGVWCSRIVKDVPEGAALMAAWLFWTSGFWANPPGRMTQTRLATSFGDTNLISPQASFVADGNYVMFADVTPLINGDINRTYSCQKLDRARGFSWCLILLFTGPGLSKRTLDLHYGCLGLGYNGDTVPWRDTFRIGAATGPPWGKFGFFSVGGDELWAGDQAILMGHRLSNWMNPWDNIGNASCSDPFTGQWAWNRWPWGPSDADAFEVSGLFPSGASAIPYELLPGCDWIYYAFAFLLVDEAGSANIDEEETVIIPGKIFSIEGSVGGLLRIYALNGRLALESWLGPGKHRIKLSAPSGVYVYTFGKRRGSFVLR